MPEWLILVPHAVIKTSGTPNKLVDFCLEIHELVEGNVLELSPLTETYGGIPL